MPLLKRRDFEVRPSSTIQLICLESRDIMLVILNIGYQTPTKRHGRGPGGRLAGSSGVGLAVWKQLSVAWDGDRLVGWWMGGWVGGLLGFS